MTCRSRVLTSFASLAFLSFACAHTRPKSCYPHSSFADPALHGRITDDLTALSAHDRPDGVVCELSSFGFRDLDQVLYVVRAPPRVIVRISVPEEQTVGYEAPLDDGIAGMIERICATTVGSRLTCVHTGRDGKWYSLRSVTSRGQSSAITWSPKPQTTADSVLDVFSALRAYATAPAPVRLPALNTAYSETYAAYQVLGLFETHP